MRAAARRVSQPTDYSAAVEALHRATAIYTREPVADQLLDRIGWPDVERTLADTSCGDGVFVIAALRRLLRAGGITDAAALRRRIRGWEIHPEAAEAARRRVASELSEYGWTTSVAWAAACDMITTGDFLTQSSPNERFGAIVGNPPYLRLVFCPALLRVQYERQLPTWARADMLHAFLARCAERLTDAGEIILVTADRWLFNASASTLRERLGTTLCVSHLERLDVASAFYRPKSRRAGTPARVHPVVVHLRPGGNGLALTRAPLYPDAWDEAPHDGPTLGTEATIRLAPWLGPHGVFVVDQERAACLPRDHLVPAVDTDDICDGELLEPRRFAIRTSPDQAPPLSVQAHVAREAHRLPPRARRSPEWLPAETWHRLDLSRETLLIPRIARSLRPVRIPAGVLPINHNLTIVASGRASLDKIEAVLSSEAADRWIRARAPRLENHYLSICTSMLRELPWPAA